MSQIFIGTRLRICILPCPNMGSIAQVGQKVFCSYSAQWNTNNHVKEKKSGKVVKYSLWVKSGSTRLHYSVVEKTFL